ncbi:MAG: DUF418 domain-containing protein [Solirubrobacterales bacterium]
MSTEAATTGSESAPRRIELIDALRGFALLGIIVVNVTFVASAFKAVGLADPDFAGTATDIVNWLVAIFFETKFYLLFSFLFGYSFTIQLESARRRGADFRARFLRRLLGLAVLGFAHAILLFLGDILVTYALMGLILLALRGLEPKRALQVAAGVLLVTAAIYGLIGLAALDSPEEFREKPAELALGVEEDEAAYSGSAGDVLDAQVADAADSIIGILLIQGPSALAMFLVGLAAGKLRALHEPERFRRLWKPMLLIGLAVGIPGGGLYAWGTIEAAMNHPARELFALAAALLLAPFLTAAYVAAFALSTHTGGGRLIQSALAPAGRMALTNYLLQSFVLAFIFTGYGAGLIGQVSPLGAIAIAFGVFLLQLPASAWWLKRFRYGPLEWVLRAFTNLAWPRWRVDRPAESQVTGR